MRPQPKALSVILVCVAVGSFASSVRASNYPPPPEPPPPPYGLAETYYSTCGGTHPPVKYVMPAIGANDQGYRDLVAYANSPEFKRYRLEVERYKAKYQDDAGSYGEVNPKTGKAASGMARREEPLEPAVKVPEHLTGEGPASDVKEMRTAAPEAPAAPAAPTGDIVSGVNQFLGYNVSTSVGVSPNPLGTGAASAKVDRDPRQDLTRWFRGFLYHDPVNSPVYDGQPEAAASLENEVAGPTPVESHYGFLICLLNNEGRALASNPMELLAALDVLWEKHWRQALGFDGDALGKRLIGDLDRAEKDAKAAQRRLELLQKQAAADAMAELRLRDQILFVEKEAHALEARHAALAAQWQRRLDFIRAMVQLIRLAPDGGFGPTFKEANAQALQTSAARILGAIGPLASGEVWTGLAQDALSLGKPAPAGNATAEAERALRVQALECAREVLLDPRLRGLVPVADFLKGAGAPAAHSEVLLKAFELLDKLGTRTLTPEALGTLPNLIALLKHADEDVAKRARWVLLRVLGVRDGKASLEEALGHLAPLVASPDAELATAAEAFLRCHTGQNRGRDPQAWKNLQKEMAAKRQQSGLAPSPAR